MTSQKNLQQLTMEKDQALADLNSVERSLSDLFRRYENLKGVLEGFKKVLALVSCLPAALVPGCRAPVQRCPGLGPCSSTVALPSHAALLQTPRPLLRACSLPLLCRCLANEQRALRMPGEPVAGSPVLRLFSALLPAEHRVRGRAAAQGPGQLSPSSTLVFPCCRAA